MTTQTGNLPYFTLQRNGALRNTGRRHQIGGFRGQACQRKLVHIPARLDAAQVGGLDDGLGGQVDDELSTLLNNTV